MKNCTKCGNYKDLSDFSKRKSSKDGLNSWCKECNKLYLKTYYIENKDNIDKANKEHYKENREFYLDKSRLYRENNKESVAEYHKEYYEQNKESLLEYKKSHYENNKETYLERSRKNQNDNKDVYLDYLKDWRSNNREKIQEYKEDNKDKWVLYNKRYWDKLRKDKPHVIAWRKSLISAVKRIGSFKESSTIDLLGYSADDLKIHMESLFKEGMSWNNWGEWHIDHIIPVSKFDSNTPMNIVNALNNLQPLWAVENLSKNNKIL